MVREAYGYYVEVTTWATQGTHLQPLRPPFPPKLEAHNPQSKHASQIVAKRCHVQRWFVSTAYGNIPSSHKQYTCIIIVDPYAGVPLSQKG